MKRYVDGNPMTNMLVDVGAFVNLMPYTTFKNLGEKPEELIKIEMMLRDFDGNTP